MGTLADYPNNEMLSKLAEIANAGTVNANATLSIYTAPVPMTPLEGITGTLLAQILLPNPAITGPTNNQLLLMIAGLTVSVSADGRASWARFKTRDNTTILDLTIGLIGSNADIELEIIDLTTSDILNLSNIPLVLKCG